MSAEDIYKRFSTHVCPYCQTGPKIKSSLPKGASGNRFTISHLCAMVDYVDGSGDLAALVEYWNQGMDELKRIEASKS